MKKLQVSMVSYLNSKPFLLGLELAGLMEDLDLRLEVPAKTAQSLLNHEVDLALVPVATLPYLANYDIMTNYCIGTQNKVDSVFLFSQVPIEQIDRIFLDSHSRTSANLLEIILRERNLDHIDLIPAQEVYAELITGLDAALMIGDKALFLRNSFNYQYDLAEMWFDLFQLPFVFALWVGNEKAKAYEGQLDAAFAKGLQQIDQLVAFYQPHYPTIDMAAYYKQHIHYDYDLPKARALTLFLEKMKQNHIINKKRTE